MTVRLRGVNLGGWLVLEKWMTPSLFKDTDAIDEYTFMHTSDAAKKLTQHRDTFITETDFQWIHAHHLNAIRIPIGYWIFEPDGPYLKGIHYVDWAFQMAERYNLYVLLDLHGAPCSQNGHDHSGRVGTAGWFQSKTARQRTISILQKLHTRYHTSPRYWGIELLNEPEASATNATLRTFYAHAAKKLSGSQAIVFSDAFQPQLMNGALQNDARAVMDVHLYHMTDRFASRLSARQFVMIARWRYSLLLRQVASHQPIIIGEWSTVLQGEKLANISNHIAHKLMCRFGQKQLRAYERHADGWFYWSYKTEEEGFWNFHWLVETGKLVPPNDP